MSLPSREAMAEGAVLLRGFARPIQHELIAASLDEIAAQAPFRHMSTPGGHRDVGGDDQLRRASAGSPIAAAIATTPTIP